ncbi:MAG TPA: hypothetical protein VFM93_03420, partial [Candidatus Limnocylindria bacterium]|nr:hypothetical protein [Candidatus Limnocylindria bacterium]
DLEVPADAPRTSLQYPGLLIYDPGTRQLALAFGRTGRLRSSAGPILALPVAEFAGDMGRLEELGNTLQFDGAQKIRVSRSADQKSPLPAREPGGRVMTVSLGNAKARAVLLESIARTIAPAFASLLPLSGFATNTYGSGPLTRFWNEKGGKEGETVIELPEDAPDPAHGVLIPGYLYYLPRIPWRGVRIATRDAAAMGLQGAGGPMVLHPFARLEGDWDAFLDEAARLGVEGKKPMRFELG